MGARKRQRAEAFKEEKKQISFAQLKDCPTSPRKMRLLADNVRGVEVKKALDILKFSDKQPSKTLEKLLLSAIANWQKKNDGVRIEDSNLFVKEIFVDSATALKRLRPAPQGRANRVLKRSNHITIILGSNINESKNTEA